MTINIEGKEIEVFFDTEDKERELDDVFAILGFNTRPSIEDCVADKPVHTSKQQAVDEHAGYCENATLFDVICNLENKFGVAVTYKDSLEVTRNKMKKIHLLPKSAAIFTRKAVLSSNEEFTKDIQSIMGMAEMIKLSDDISFGVDMENETIKVLKKNSLLFSVNSNGKVKVSNKLSDEDFIGLKESIDIPNAKFERETDAKITVLPPEKQLTTKPLQKSINVEATVVDSNKEEKATVIHNPEQTIALANTEQIALKVDIDLLKQYINIDSLRHAPAELKGKIMMRLEGALKQVLAKEEAAKTWLDHRKKYGLLKCAFFGKDRYTLFNGKHYMKFTDANHFQFDTKLN
jgi:hypothetical protein